MKPRFSNATMNTMSVPNEREIGVYVCLWTKCKVQAKQFRVAATASTTIVDATQLWITKVKMQKKQTF